MPPRGHDLPTGFERLTEQIAGPVLDSIVIQGRHHGILIVPGEYNTSRQPTARPQVQATNPDRCEVEDRAIGGPDHYVQTYRVWNYNDSPAFAQLVDDEGTERGGRA